MILQAGNQTFDVQAVAFDKDGLLFESHTFWLELARVRAHTMAKHLPPEQVLRWLAFFGVQAHLEGEDYVITDVDSMGIMAIAACWEEITVTAGFLTEHGGMDWTQARRVSQQVFQESDRSLDLKRALKAKPGFPDIFRRLRAAGVPYGIATSAPAHRAIQSVDLFDDAKALSFLITPDDVSVGKPEPEMLYAVSQRLGIPTEKILMVGDSYVDVLMARRAGAIGIGIPEEASMVPQMEPYANAILSSLEELVF